MADHSKSPRSQGRLRADAESESPLYFGAMTHAQAKHDCMQKNRIDCQTPLKSPEQYTGLEMD